MICVSGSARVPARGPRARNEAEDTGGLSPAKDAGEGWRKSGRKDCRILMEDQVQS